MHCFVRAISNFQVQIADGGTMKCEGHCENVKLQMEDYQLKTHMFAIHMGGCDIVLGVDWLPHSWANHNGFLGVIYEF